MPGFYTDGQNLFTGSWDSRVSCKEHTVSDLGAGKKLHIRSSNPLSRHLILHLPELSTWILQVFTFIRVLPGTLG